MRWHLCNPLGVSERTTEADSEFWAKRRFVPIPKGWFVCSDASYQMGWVKAGLPENLCAKCLRHPVTGTGTKCEACRATHNHAVCRAGKRKRQRLTTQERSDAARKGAERMSPEMRARKSERLRRIMPQVCERRDPKVKERVRQANIRRGIEQRAAKRAQQLSLFGA